MEDLITAVNQAIDELEGYYDGAPDSRTLWLGSIIVDLREAVEKATRPKRHYHVAKNDGTDTCAECGKDLRNMVHLRLGERP